MTPCVTPAGGSAAKKLFCDTFAIFPDVDACEKAADGSADTSQPGAMLPRPGGGGAYQTHAGDAGVVGDVGDVQDFAFVVAAGLRPCRGDTHTVKLNSDWFLRSG